MGRGNQTTEERTEYNRRWREANPDKVAAWQPAARERARRWYANMRNTLIDAYGGKCTCPPCGETIRQFLTIDHIDGVPDDHREPNGKRMNTTKLTGIMFRALESTGVVDDRCTVLCFNCNSGRALNGGVCPHLGGDAL